MWRMSRVSPALRILVVEDDVIIAMLMAEVLQGMGHVVCATAYSEADGVAAALRHRPDMMIVDSRLGQGSGVTAVEQILRVSPIPHVFVSGDIAGVHARRPDAVVVEKPFRDADLARAIQRALAIKPAA